MTTKTTGGKITGLLALTLEAQAALAVGDPVHISGNYECGKADGSKPVVGFVSVANVRRSAATGFYPSANAPGDVTVEARGLMVLTFTAAIATAAGVAVGINNAQKVVIDGGGVAHIGVTLTLTGGTNLPIDVLVGAV